MGFSPGFLFFKKWLVFLCISLFPVFTFAQNLDSDFQKLSQWVDSHGIAYQQLALATSQIGHRLTGTENGRKAEEFVFRTLKNQGIDSVFFHPFEFQAWQRKSCHLELVPHRSDNYVEFKAVSLANTSSVNGIWHMVDVGDGLPSDFEQVKDKVLGKCALMNLGLKDSLNRGKANLHRAEKVALALQYGAKAVLFVHPGDEQQLLTGTASLTGDVVSIPALCISGPDGAMARQWLRKERLMAEMKVSNPVVSGTARNVLAWIPGQKNCKETLVFTAHLDSWDLATGATDNGLGAFTLIDIARALNLYRGKWKRNLLFIWTMGEEQGLLGSKSLVRKWEGDGFLEKIKLVINLDMVGNPVGFNAFSWQGLDGCLQGFGENVKKFLPDGKFSLVNSPGLHSDHQPFLLKGIPATSAISQMPDSIYECYHANCDNLNLIQPQYLSSSAKVHSMLAFYLGRAKRLPFKSKSDEKLVKWLTQTHLKEKLQISGEWKWK
jgi:Iap family predicted aminopeptidase